MSLVAPFTALVLAALPAPPTEDVADRVRHGTAVNGDVELHYAALGEAGEVVVLLHGFPDYWYTWRHQMAGLADRFRVVAPDLRGYNRSGKPAGVDAYAMRHLMADVEAVVLAQGVERATIVGHDWGAAVAWNFAMWYPHRVDRLGILSVPHPSGFARELAENDEQRTNSQYARDFQEDGAHESLTARGLAAWVTDDAARARYVAAFGRSDIEAMLHYYKANYPKPSAATAASPPGWKRITAPTLVLHGMKDRYLHHRGHAYCWEWIDAETSIVMLPEAGHFLQQDRPERVTRLLREWLLRPR